jgi:hypothetical protein
VNLDLVEDDQKSCCYQQPQTDAVRTAQVGESADHHCECANRGRVEAFGFKELDHTVSSSFLHQFLYPLSSVLRTGRLRVD